MRTIYALLATSLLSFFGAISPVYSQNSNGPDPVTQSNQQVKIDVDRGGLMCPFLGPQLKMKLDELDGASNIELNKKESRITMSLPGDTEVTEEQIKSIAVRVGYPPADVHVVFTQPEKN